MKRVSSTHSLKEEKQFNCQSLTLQVLVNYKLSRCRKKGLLILSKINFVQVNLILRR